MSARARARVCVCVCERERERERVSECVSVSLERYVGRIPACCECSRVAKMAGTSGQGNE